MTRSYRIVREPWATNPNIYYYYVESRSTWWPWWRRLNNGYPFDTLTAARTYIRFKLNGDVVEHINSLDDLPS